MIKDLTIKQRFKSSIQRGTGEAYLIMQSNPTIDFSNSIIKASLINFAEDPQSEGDRVLYISELITLSIQQNKIRTAILNGLATEQKDTWALVQLFRLAAVFAKQGDKVARKAIYKRFYKKIINGSGWCGYDSITELDGLKGLKFIATTIGKSLEKSPDDWEDDSIICYFQTENPKIKVLQELEKASNQNQHIKIYLNIIKKNKERVYNYEPPVFNLETLKERITNSKSAFIPPGFTRSLSQSDFKAVADEFLIEKDKLKQGKYLCIFSRIKFPYDYQPLFRFADAKVNNNNRIVEWAVNALKFFSGKDIRQFAIEKLNKTNSPWTYLNLLVNNYKVGDGKLLTSIANRYKNENNIHFLVYSFITIYKTNKTKECKQPLEAIYDKLNCGICRREIIKILIDNGVLSNKIKQEIKYDSYEETRLLYLQK